MLVCLPMLMFIFDYSNSCEGSMCLYNNICVFDLLYYGNLYKQNTNEMINERYDNFV